MVLELNLRKKTGVNLFVAEPTSADIMSAERRAMYVPLDTPTTGCVICCIPVILEYCWVLTLYPELELDPGLDPGLDPELVPELDPELDSEQKPANDSRIVRGHSTTFSNSRVDSSRVVTVVYVCRSRASGQTTGLGGFFNKNSR